MGIIFAHFWALRAEAPSGGRNTPGGRSIANLQEEEFDSKLQRYELCYGIRVQANSVSQLRRKTCKAQILKSLDKLLAEGDRYFEEVINFECRDYASVVKSTKSLSESILVAPENNGYEELLAKFLITRKSDPILIEHAEHACKKLQRCVQNDRLGHFSLPTFLACALESDPYVRRATWDLYASKLFNRSPATNKVISHYLAQP